MPEPTVVGTYNIEVPVPKDLEDGEKGGPEMQTVQVQVMRFDLGSASKEVVAKSEPNAVKLAMEQIIAVVLVGFMIRMTFMVDDLLDSDWSEGATQAQKDDVEPKCDSLYFFLMMMTLVRLLTVCIMTFAKKCNKKLLAYSLGAQCLGVLISSVWGTIVFSNGWDQENDQCNGELVLVSKIFAYLALVGCVAFGVLICCGCVFFAVQARSGEK